MSKDLRNTLLAALVFLALTCGIGYVDYNIKTELDGVVEQNTQLQADIDRLMSEASPKVKEQLDKQLAELNVNFKEYVKILPSEDVATEENLLRTVQRYINDTGITLDSYTARRLASKADFEEIGVAIRGGGTFEQLVNFLNALERHETFLRVNGFQTSVMFDKVQAVGGPGGKDVLPLNITLDVSTYRYLPKKK